MKYQVNYSKCWKDYQLQVSEIEAMEVLSRYQGNKVSRSYWFCCGVTLTLIVVFLIGGVLK